jgi:hypothetical protein
MAASSSRPLWWTTARSPHPNPEAASAQARGEGVLGGTLEGLAELALVPRSGQAGHRDCVVWAAALLDLEARQAGPSPHPHPAHRFHPGISIDQPEWGAWQRWGLRSVPPGPSSRGTATALLVPLARRGHGHRGDPHPVRRPRVLQSSATVTGAACDTGTVPGAGHTATQERRADRAARAWRSTARLPPGGVKEQHLVSAPAGRAGPRDVPKHLDLLRPERNRGHRHRSGRRGHQCSSTRSSRTIGFSRSTAEGKRSAVDLTRMEAGGVASSPRLSIHGAGFVRNPRWAEASGFRLQVDPWMAAITSSTVLRFGLQPGA